MLDSSLEAVFTCCQFTGLGVFYTYFLSFVLAFNFPLTKALYTASLGAILVFLSGNNPFDNRIFEPKTFIVYGLFTQSFCSATLAACFFADGDKSRDGDALILQILPKISIIIFYIAFYLTHTASMFYVKILSRSGKYSDNASVLSWIVTIILMGFKIVGYDEFSKSLGVTMIAFGFLYLSLAFFINDKLPQAYGLFDHEIAKSFRFQSLQNVLKYEEHRSFTSNDGIATFYVRNLTNDKVAIDISFSNPEDNLIVEHFSQKYIRGRGHLKIDVKRGSMKKDNDRFFVFYAKSLKDLENPDESGFLTIHFQ